MTQAVDTAMPDKANDAKKKSVLLPVVIILVGVLVLLYPVVATQWNNVRQQSVANDYAQLQQSEPEDLLRKQFESALVYNQTHTKGPILDPWLTRIGTDNPEYQRYAQELDDYPVMARLIVPSGKIDLPVYHGTSDEVLHKGVGHLFGTDLPVGGEGTHAVLTGHTGLTSATLFDHLDEVKEGDAIYVQVAGEKLKYEVHSTAVVLPDETDSLKTQQGKDLLTLITCTPYGINSHRLLVHAHRVPMDPDDKAFEESATQMQWWMWAILLAVLIILILLAWWLFRRARQQKALEKAK
ncbi:class C sortase [uncultured Corynebacterium sp.]|uniref:class C sortase n=1 Tax=uncultured Corynebacterium sp. TaxID=159447 RepID=UPI002604C5DE|nr:class C sortase [uncultured Corynebacterium sp.]